jgi:hypothetical protein
MSQKTELFMTYLHVVWNTKSEAKEEDGDKDEMKEDEEERERTKKGKY